MFLSLKMLFLVAAVLLVVVAPSYEGSVSCGVHRAAYCTDCPEGRKAGKPWCNGDCVWMGLPTQGECVLDATPCTHKTRQKTMYAHMSFDPSLTDKHFTKMEVVTVWNNLTINPSPNQYNGGVYIGYTMGIKDETSGYMGIQLLQYKGQFLFSFWDKGRFEGKYGDKMTAKKADFLAWPANTSLCKRNCLDCGLPELRKWHAKGLTTGTQCKVEYPDMKVGDSYKIVMTRRKGFASLETKSYGGMPAVHKNELNELDETIKGGVWDVHAYDQQRNDREILVGSIFLEGSGDGMYYLTTFDEMTACTRCDKVQHKDTRHSLKVWAEDKSERQPTKMEGLTQKSESTCKKYWISGSKVNGSVTFEQGPFTTGDFAHDGKKYQPVW